MLVDTLLDLLALAWLRRCKLMVALVFEEVLSRVGQGNRQAQRLCVRRRTRENAPALIR